MMAEVVKFGLGIAGVFHLLGGVERVDEIAFLDAGAVRDEVGECERPAGASVDGGNQDFGGTDGLDRPGDAHLAFGFGLGGRRWAGRLGNGRRGARAGG